MNICVYTTEVPCLSHHDILTDLKSNSDLVIPLSGEMHYEESKGFLYFMCIPASDLASSCASGLCF